MSGGMVGGGIEVEVGMVVGMVKPGMLKSGMLNSGNSRNSGGVCALAVDIMNPALPGDLPFRPDKSA